MKWILQNYERASYTGRPHIFVKVRLQPAIPYPGSAPELSPLIIAVLLRNRSQGLDKKCLIFFGLPEKSFRSDLEDKTGSRSGVETKRRRLRGAALAMQCRDETYTGKKS